MLKGSFVGLRAIERADLSILLEFRNKPEYRRYFREYRELSMANQNVWYEENVMKDPKTVMFSIIELESNRLLGACGLCYIDWTNKNADFSIYMYGFKELGLHRLWAEIYDFDDLKRIFFENLGFKLEGRHRETHWSESKWHDSLFYSLLNGEC